MTPSNITNFIKTQAKNLGFSACGISPPEYQQKYIDAFKWWINNNYYGSMLYLKNNIELRIDLQKFFPEAKSVVVVILSYNTNLKQKDPEAPKISKYAFGKDYHKIIKKKLKKLLMLLSQNFSNKISGKIFVDSSPVMERPLAVQAGLGWIGKNGCLINPAYGSYIFIGGIVLNTELIFDNPFEKSFCGKCSLCIQACPTRAIIDPQIIDARKCISYLTIESKNTIPLELRNFFNNYVFGCDICQEVCPWNKKAPELIEPKLLPGSELLELSKKDWINLTPEKYEKLFAGTPVKRVKYNRLKENIRILLNL